MKLKHPSGATTGAVEPASGKSEDHTIAFRRNSVMADAKRPANSASNEETTSSQLPHKSPLLEVCGDHINLVIDNVYEYICQADATDVMVKRQMMERDFAIRQLWERPLEGALQSRHVECGRCSPFRTLQRRSGVVSGSMAERLGAPQKPPLYQTSSDIDVMIELGPVDWVVPPSGNIPYEEVGTVGTAAEFVVNQRGPENRKASCLVITETENPGFVLLLQERRDDCPHQECLIFNAETVLQIFSEFRVMHSGESDAQLCVNGPAVTHTNSHTRKCAVAELDEVPCVHIPTWFIPDEFFTRHRPHNWPPEDVLENIRQFGLHLVPVGAPGSTTQRQEFRISFSRAEVVVAALLSQQQRSVVVIFKICKAGVEDGKLIKSYYAKTALLWLCEQTPTSDWTGVFQNISKLLDCLDKAVDTGNLPCYFWSWINLLRFTSSKERTVMAKVLRRIRRNITDLLTRGIGIFEPLLQKMLMKSSVQLIERQVRVCLARLKITKGIASSLMFHMITTTTDTLDMVLPMLVVSDQYTTDEVLRVFAKWRHWYYVQTGLYQALEVAPDDVLQLHCKTELGFVWDAAPLLDLLTEDDLQVLLGDPDAVKDWLRRQHQLPETERPAGLPADLRSPRDLCDLLLNIPLLSFTLRMSVPDKWYEYHTTAKNISKSWSQPVPTFDQKKEESLYMAAHWQGMAANFHTRLGMDAEAALRTAERVSIEIQRLCKDPETVREHERLRRSFPDRWGVARFLSAAE